jgi:hypothetical protein
VRYTVVGLWIDNEPPSRVAAWVEADDPDEAIVKAASGEGTEDEAGDLLVAGVFEGWLTAADEQ